MTAGNRNQSSSWGLMARTSVQYMFVNDSYATWSINCLRLIEKYIASILKHWLPRPCSIRQLWHDDNDDDDDDDDDDIKRDLDGNHVNGFIRIILDLLALICVRNIYSTVLYDNLWWFVQLEIFCLRICQYLVIYISFQFSCLNYLVNAKYSFLIKIRPKTFIHFHDILSSRNR